ncbi:MAG: hypothetical protein IIA54_05625 [Chloroflexi bacterium]|nr:hypothetical protein [Chloroflexota bacterium]
MNVETRMLAIPQATMAAVIPRDTRGRVAAIRQALDEAAGITSGVRSNASCAL